MAIIYHKLQLYNIKIWSKILSANGPDAEMYHNRKLD